MKKKVIGIILTLAMVLTMLPAVTLADDNEPQMIAVEAVEAGTPVAVEAVEAVEAGMPAEKQDFVAAETNEKSEEVAAKKDDCPFAVYLPDGKNQATPWDREKKKGDYEWSSETNILYILSSDLIVTMAKRGTSANATIEIPYEQEEKINVEKITFKDLKIVYDGAEKNAYNGAIVYINSPDIEINLVGENQIESKTDRSEENILQKGYGGIIGQNLTFTGDGNLNIKCTGVAINAREIEPENPEEGEGEPMNITFNGTGKVTVEQCLYEEPGALSNEVQNVTLARVRSAEDDLAFEGQQNIFYQRTHYGSQAHRFVGAVAATGDINVISGLLDVISKKANSETCINMETYAVVAENELFIDTPNDVSIKSGVGIAAAGGKVIIGENAKNITLVGYYKEENEEENVKRTEAEAGALFSIESEPIIPETFTVVGSKDQEFDVDSTKLKTASFEKVTIDEEEPESVALAVGTLSKTFNGAIELVKIKSFYTCFVEKEVAKTLVIKAPEEPTTPVNPKTEDTSAMIIWAFAGLAALAVAAGILVSRKQKGKN